MPEKQEKIDIKKLKFAENGLIPVVAQDYESGEVLMLAYMNAAAVEKTFETGYAHYYSRSKKTVSKYGETLGNTQKLMTAFLDHDNDTLLIKVKQKGKADPEKGSFTCFPTQIKGEYKDIGGEMFGRLQRIVAEYKKNPEDGAYTSFLFARGVDRIGKKVGEEAVEFVIAAKNPEKSGVIAEAADLLYHTMVLLEARDVKISEVCSELCKRNR
ncbi:MAG: bifunctional phosphoribosyl-AMP cyclohydrolase/phosphoribosyl-ATP diphosphatase HisIE [Clostridiales bacterium]|nr:bifunctional phosphoribosyl-AMP cyclohydrolase/phosphoribosyl-ATP diphosphatase HisIE [Clostridiales bacterium]